jgi:hypothetical protein
VFKQTLCCGILLLVEDGHTKGRYVKLDSAKMRWHRDRLGWTIDTLAEQAEVAEGTALRAEHGEDIRPSSGRRIARAFGVDISELVPEKPGVVHPKAQPPPPEEVAAAAELVGQVAEQAEATASQVAEQATGTASEGEHENIVPLDSADDIGAYVNEILWNLPESVNRRLEIYIHEDNSAEIHIKPSTPTTSKKRGSGATGRYVQSATRKTRRMQARESRE